MGGRELIESLQRMADEKTRAIRREAEAEAEGIRVETAAKIEQMRQEYDRLRAGRAEEETARALSEADSRARMSRLTAEGGLSRRFFSHASSRLGRLRDGQYPGRFSALVGELPRRQWERVSVNREDLGRGREFFPGAEIIADDRISGGVEVAIEDGKIRVINTFEKRLERVWEDLLPDLMKDAYEEVSERGTP
jgi:V/A-type H+-transporting ATPase subunit E